MPTLQLSTPVDLAVRDAGISGLIAPGVGVLSKRYRVDPTRPWDIAGQVRTGIEAAMDQGQGKLFLHLSRADRTTDHEAGTLAVARAVATAPPSMSVTNLGVVDPGTDPVWVRGMCGYLAPSPNHVLFVSGAEYRGRLIQASGRLTSSCRPTSRTEILARYPRLVARLLTGASRSGPITPDPT